MLQEFTEEVLQLLDLRYNKVTCNKTHQLYTLIIILIFPLLS